MIQVKRLSKKFKNVNALDGINVDFLPGVATGILGPNGCGKTTLIKAILSLVMPDVGEIEMDGQSILGLSSFRENVGYLPQNPQFPVNLSANEIFHMIEDIRGIEGKDKQHLIELFDLKKHLNRPTGQLSGGTRQKVSAVIAFMFNPRILILDEPTVGLDPLSVVRLKDLIKNSTTQGKTVILVTHMLAEIEQLVQRMYFLLEGRVRFSGSLDEVRSQAGVSGLDQAVVQLMALSQNSR